MRVISIGDGNANGCRLKIGLQKNRRLIHFRQSKNEILGRLELSEREANFRQLEISDELGALSLGTGMPITQENGQRRCGPPLGYTGPPPPRGSEVFVGKLPRNIYENEIFPLFLRCGNIYEIRMMMDFSGNNRGYCFVQYWNPTDARRAIKELNNYEIQPGRKIGVLKSVDNCRLFIGGIPKNKTKDEIYKEISSITEGVLRVSSYPLTGPNQKNRGFAFVEYENHKAAAMARRKMIPGRIQMFDVDVQVDWADPEPQQAENLHIRNLGLFTTEQDLFKLFNAHSDNGVEKVTKIGPHCAFVNFKSREQAENAKHALDNTSVHGSTIEINWARKPKPNPAIGTEPRSQLIGIAKKKENFPQFGHGQPYQPRTATSGFFGSKGKQLGNGFWSPAPGSVFNMDMHGTSDLGNGFPQMMVINDGAAGIFSPLVYGHPSPFVPSNSFQSLLNFTGSGTGNTSVKNDFGMCLSSPAFLPSLQFRDQAQ